MRRQESRRKSWPVGLRERIRGGRAYYSYVDPKTKREVGLGLDLQAAITAIRVVERKRATDPVQAAIAKIERPASTFGDHLDWFLNTYLPSRRNKVGGGLSDGTVENYRLLLERTREPWGPRAVSGISRSDVVSAIEKLPAESGNRMRSMLNQLFAQARARGLRDDNPVEGTVKRDVVIRRDRLELARYKAIHEKAPPWLQRAMTLCLLSLQRPGDLSAALREDWDADKNAWHVRQSKSRGHGYGLLRILPHAELRAAIQACHDAQVEDCPYLLAREPEKKRKAKGRGHWAQLSDEILSRAFAEVRDERAKSLEWKWQGTPASFYEIKALGARLYEEAGRPVSWIQALAGHQDEATTRIYTDRHREKWVEVSLAE